MEEQVKLMNALVEAEKELEMYETLAKSARERVNQIRMAVNTNYTPAGSRYTSEELRDVKRRIVGELAGRGWVQLAELVGRIGEHDADLVMRELHKLANNPRSDVLWNQRKGPASRYGRFGPGTGIIKA